MNFRNFLFIALAFFAFSATVFSADSPVKKPNVVLFVIDDPGYQDFGCQGSVAIKTPNIDFLAKNGVRFTNAYTTGCVCSPTRAGLMTGRYQQRFGMDANAEGNGKDDRAPRAMDIDQTTLAQRMKSLGYTTGIVGKWHLGVGHEYLPLQRGFDEFYGLLPHGLGGKEADGSPVKFYRGNTKLEERPKNAMEQFCTEALSFIDRNGSEPFFLYLPFTAVHAAYIGASPYIDTLDNDVPQNRRKYMADVMEVDNIIGRIMGSLRKKGLEDNTLVFCFGDNGGPGGAPVNGPLRGTKWYLWEGGIRVPFMAYWKGRIQENVVSDHPVIQLDVTSTILSAAGANIQSDWKLDGVDLMPLLQGKTDAAPHDALFWRFGVQYAVRQGDWKLVKANRDMEPQLYNLKNDIGETTNLAEREPEKTKMLQSLWDSWNEKNEPPRWIDNRWDGMREESKQEKREKRAVKNP